MLLVEDEVMIRMMVADMLEELGHSVAGEAGEINQAIKLAQSSEFDLAILEVRLVIDGVEIVRRLGGHVASDPLVPAIALVNTLRTSSGIPAGARATTGTYTGLERAQADSIVEVTFAGFGTVTCGFK